MVKMQVINMLVGWFMVGGMRNINLRKTFLKK